MSRVIKHRCVNHVIDPLTETLIIGTFNPDTETNPADFFYGRPRNHLWVILEAAFNETGRNLKKASREEKIAFAREKRIDFIDLISEIGDEPPDYSDVYLDKLDRKTWRNVIQEIDKLRSLRRVCISRKRFNDVPNIGAQVEKIAEHLQNKPIVFRCLHTPARAFSRALPDWIDFLHSQPKLMGV